VRADSFLGTLPSLILKGRREAGLIGAAAVILLFLTGFSFWLTQRVLRDAETADELSRFNANLTVFVQKLRTVESSQRGYLLTGSSDFLAPYVELQGQLLQTARELQSTAPKQLAAAKQISTIFVPLSAKLEEMAQTVALANSGRKDEAIERVKDGFGRKLTTQIEDTVQRVQDDGTSLIRRNERDTRQLQSFKVFIDGVGAFLVLTFSFLSLSLLLHSNAAIRTAREALAVANLDLEETVAQRTAALRRANEEIQRFAYIVSHDLRSPLVNIMGFTSELETLSKELFEKLAQANGLAGSDTLSKDFDEAFGFIKSSIARMDRLIGAILRISREGNRPLNPEPVDTKALVEGLFSGLTHQIREKGVEVEIGSLPPIVTDRLALEQILSNLIENAMKFLKPGVKGEIRVEGHTHVGENLYTVSDNGRGIDPKDHQRVFELFRRSGPQDVPGEGMGLAYVTALVRRLGGTITIQSELGRGSTFRLTLPTTLGMQTRKAA
jgi:signal transduction histidine kinase